MAGCLGGILAAGLANLADRDSIVLTGDLFAIGPGGARDLLGTIVGGTATMMALTYTLTLLIFTLAAGQLGPRLLDSFYDNRVNQVTITIIGATFVFSLVSLWLVREGHEAALACIVAMVLSILSVMTLIYFVHDVARRVLVDNEIALTAKRLRGAIRSAFPLSDAKPGPEPTIPERDPGTPRVVHAEDTGYMRAVDIEELVGDMAKYDAAVEITVAPGDYVVERMPVALVHRAGSVEDWGKTINARLALGRSRSSEGDILFSANLLVEIALRALSPGINDSFTAVSAVDHLSGALAGLLRRRPPSPLYLGDDGVARVTATTPSAKEIIDTAFHPIRRSATGNMLVSCAMIDALRRMIVVSDEEHIPHLRHHARLVARTALSEDAPQDDRNYLDNRLKSVEAEAA